MQKKYTEFGGCFSEEKKTAMIVGAAPGMIIGIVGALSGDKRTTGLGAIAAAVGAIIGYQVAWQACLIAFPVKSQTSVVNDRESTLAESGASATEAVTKSLSIQNVSAGPLVFGKDINVTVTYRYISSDPAAQDVKARVFRNLIFKGPDGVQREVASSTEDIIQQGVSRATFAIPTPSVNDAKELASTKDWAFKFVVEVDGMREETISPLGVSQPSAEDATSQQSPPVKPTSSTVPSQPDASRPSETITLLRGTRLLREANSPEIVVTLPSTQGVTVLQRIVQGNFNWVQVRLQDGKEGWFRGGPR